MKGIIGCEESQAVTLAFVEKGHDFRSCDLLPCSGGRPDIHIQDSIFHALCDSRNMFLDFLGAHPPCTYLANSGVCWLASVKPKKGFTWSDKYQIYLNLDRYKKMEEAALFFKSLYSNIETIGRGYLENPIMHKYAMEIIGVKPTQIIQPYMFGHPEQKATCLWLISLPELEETNNVKAEMMLLKDSERQRLHYLPPSPERQKLRSKTFKGIAKAMADQWG